MSGADIQKLAHLREADFERRVWIALRWARDWAIFRGDFPAPDLVREFEGLYNDQERRDILATVTVMDFSNRFMNTVTGMELNVERKYGEAEAAKEVPDSFSGTADRDPP